MEFFRQLRTPFHVSRSALKRKADLVSLSSSMAMICTVGHCDVRGSS